MIYMLWSFLKNHLPASMFVALVFMFCAVAGFEAVEIRKLKNDLELARAKTESLYVSNTSLLASLRAQNAALIAMDKAAAEKHAATAKAMAVARKNSSLSRRQAQNIHTAMAPGDECAQFTWLLRRFIKP